jgi:aryl-alcohol dehydrogenase-like predicted oxidoreductase
MALPGDAYLQVTPDLRICRLLTGMWQVSGAHGRIDPSAAVAAMVAYHDAGYTTWDLADHYGPAEDLIGALRRRLAASRGAQALGDVQAFTKWVPSPGRITRRTVEEAIARSCRRMGVDALDLLQFHWWEYEHPGFLDALDALAQLQREGTIRHLALTNFDTEHLRLIVERGLPIVSNQVQYSLIDRRPEVQLAAYCRQHGISLLAYGTLCGGLLSERYLGQPEPPRGSLSTASLQKYKPMVDAWGDWGRFQRLLTTLKQIATKHQVSIANVAARYVLDRPAVAGVIVGARLGVSDHLADNTRVFGLRLVDAADLQAIEASLADPRDLYRLIGDCGDEYRR